MRGLDGLSRSLLSGRALRGPVGVSTLWAEEHLASLDLTDQGPTAKFNLQAYHQTDESQCSGAHLSHKSNLQNTALENRNWPILRDFDG
jgi:hypothetical protein